MNLLALQFGKTKLPANLVLDDFLLCYYTHNTYFIIKYFYIYIYYIYQRTKKFKYFKIRLMTYRSSKMYRGSKLTF